MFSTDIVIKVTFHKCQNHFSTSADYSTSSATLLTGWGRVEEGGPWSPKVSPYENKDNSNYLTCHPIIIKRTISYLILMIKRTISDYLILMIIRTISNYLIFPVEEDSDSNCIRYRVRQVSSADHDYYWNIF